MPTLICNGKAVLSGRISMPRIGVWHAELDIDADKTMQGQASIICEGGLSWIGQIIKSEASLNSSRVQVQVVGALLGDDCKPAFFRNVTAVTPLKALIGSALSASSDKAVLSHRLPSWTIVQQAMADAIKSIADECGASWRVLPDGKIWLGIEQWPTTMSPGALQSTDGASRISSYKVTSFNALPGSELAGQRIERVEHRIDWFGLTTVLFFGEKAVQPIEALVDHYMARIDHYAMYPGKVVSQNADGTLEIKVDDVRLPGFSKVPIRYGVPGMRAEVAAGARIGLEFERGNPSLPVATVWASADVRRLHIDASTDLIVNGGSAAIARVGDSLDLGTWALTSVTPVVLTIALPGGQPPIVITSTSTMPLVTSPSVPVVAKITHGASKFHG